MTDAFWTGVVVLALMWACVWWGERRGFRRALEDVKHVALARAGWEVPPLGPRQVAVAEAVDEARDLEGRRYLAEAREALEDLDVREREGGYGGTD